jgi:hypothetical protein
MKTAPSTGRRSLADRLRRLEWTPAARAAFISALAVAMGSLFVATYSLALGDPVPHRIDAGLVGDPAAHTGAVKAVQGVAQDSLVFRPYGSTAEALHAIDLQDVYAALDLVSPRPTLYVASAAGASVARVLERVSTADPRVRVVDSHPLAAEDPSGVDIFYLMLVSTIVGFLSVFQVRANAAGLSLRQWCGFVVALAAGAGLVFALVDAALHQLDIPILETWGILALQIAAVASFASLAGVVLGRWSILPTWLFFVVLGNSASGGAVAAPLLPRPFAIISQWLPSGATVESLRNAIYFRHYQHVQPAVVSAVWAVALFALMVVVSHRLGTSPGGTRSTPDPHHT